MTFVETAFYTLAALLALVVIIRTGNLPWLGDGLRVRLAKAYIKNYGPGIVKKKGPVWRVKCLGRNMVFVCDPAAMNSMTNFAARKKYSQPAFRHDFNFDANILGIDDKVATRDVTDAVSNIQNATLGGGHAAEMSASFRENFLEGITKYGYAIPVGKRVDLTDWAVRSTYFATTRSLFGKEFPIDESYPFFMEFEQGFFLLLRKLDVFAPKAVRAREVLVTLIAAQLRLNMSSASHTVQQTHAVLTSEKYNLSHEDVCRFLLILLWGGNVNSVWVDAWCLMYTGTNSSILREVSSQVQAATAPGADEPSWERDAMDFSSTPLVHQIVDETLRYGSTGMSYRLCIEDGILPTVAGKDFPVFKGDIVIGTPYLFHHSREYWPTPDAWAPKDNAGVNAAREKQGDLKVFYPYGGGQGQCPGRRVAHAETSQFLTLFFEHYEIVEGTQDPLPEGDWTKTGPGFVPTKKGWFAEVRKRNVAAA